MKTVLVLVATLIAALPVVRTTPLATYIATSARQSSSNCDLYAARHGSDRASVLHRRARHHRGRPGTLRNPFASPQRLSQALRPGQTGCLRSGTYNIAPQLRFNHGGSPGRPITLRSTPGEHATLHGGPVYIPAGSSYVSLVGLGIQTGATPEVGVQIMSSSDALVSDNITNRYRSTSCVILGSTVGYGRAQGTVIEHDVIHQCGTGADGNLDHAIYFDNVNGATVSHNVIWGASGFAIHLYPHAVGNTVTHNVIGDNGNGVIFAGNAQYHSSGNVVANNVITNSKRGYGVQSYWGGAVGSGNILMHNCIYAAAKAAIARPTTGFSSIDNVAASVTHGSLLRRGGRCQRVIGFDPLPAIRRLL